jgi:hypothetical protein
VFSIFTLCIPPCRWYKDKQGWVPLQEKRSIRCLPGHIPKELRCLLASMVWSACDSGSGFPNTILSCMRITTELQDRFTRTLQLFSHGATNSSLKQGQIRSLIHTHTHSYHKLLQFFLPSPLLGKPLICRIPLRDSQELIRLPFHPLGQDLTED